MATVITDEQRLALRKEVRFQDMVRAAVANHASYLHLLDPTALPQGMTHTNWAKQKYFIGESIIFNPNSQDNETWYAQFIMALKGAAIWDTDVEKTIDFMIANGQFETIAKIVFYVREENVRYS